MSFISVTVNGTCMVCEIGMENLGIVSDNFSKYLSYVIHTQTLSILSAFLHYSCVEVSYSLTSDTPVNFLRLISVTSLPLQSEYAMIVDSRGDEHRGQYDDIISINIYCTYSYLSYYIFSLSMY